MENIILNIVILFGISIFVVLLLHRLNIPSIVGLLLAGIIIGPYGGKLIKEIDAVNKIADIGIVLLMFSIGLECSFSSLGKLKRFMIIGGGLQVVVTTLIFFILTTLAGFNSRSALLTGLMFSLSSTAIVIRILASKGELDSPHGRLSIGLLLFQDLCIIPIMIAIPIIRDMSSFNVLSLSLMMTKSVTAIVLIGLFTYFVLPKIFDYVAKFRSNELFMMLIVIVCLGVAWVASKFGISYTLGAFIAGLVLSETRYGYQIVSDIVPFKELGSSIFFVSIGMLLPVSFLFSNILPVAGWYALLIVIKILVVVGVALIFKYPLRYAIYVAFALAQIGEFSFILAKTGYEESIITDVQYSRFIAISILSMMTTPFLIMFSKNLADRLKVKSENLRKVSEENLGGLNNHVIIIGYGLNGRNLSRVLKATGISYVVLELNSQTVKEAKKEGEPIFYADATNRELIKRFMINSAKVVVIAISDASATRRIVAVIRSENPDVHIIARTRYASEINHLYRLGSNDVIPEEFETSVEIFARVLSKYYIPDNIIKLQVELARQEGYGMFRDIDLGKTAMAEIQEIFSKTTIEKFMLTESSPIAGKTIRDVELRLKTGATVIAVVRKGEVNTNPEPDFVFAEGDILVIFGKHKQIDDAVNMLDNRQS